jgi:hypothetical protein
VEKIKYFPLTYPQVKLLSRKGETKNLGLGKCEENIGLDIFVISTGNFDVVDVSCRSTLKMEMTGFFTETVEGLKNGDTTIIGIAVATFIVIISIRKYGIVLQM